jgi:hypothetical protein
MTTVTDANGQYVMHLAPARYVLKASNPGLPLLSSEKEVELTKDVVVDLTVDSGIR